jgi:hypothetical protein
MSKIEAIKTAAAELGPEDQFELFRWWVQSDAFKQRQLAALKHDLTTGLADLENGRYQSYDESHVMQLAEEISRSGLERLDQAVKNRPPLFV